MNNTNGFHPSSLSITDNEINDTTQCVLTPHDKAKRLKSKTRSMKEFSKKSKSINVKKKRLKHDDSNNNNSTKKLQHYSHTNIEHIPSTSSSPHIHSQLIHNYCNLCGEYDGEMISCDTCSTTFHLHCINRKEDIVKGSYLCENCQILITTQDNLINKDKQEKVILPFSFDPKKNLHLNGFKKNQSTLEQIKLPIASNGQSLIQPSGEIKFRAISNKNLSSSNLKRKRIDSSSPPPSSSTTIDSSNIHLETLHYLFLSYPKEEFHGPSFLSKNDLEKYCFICRKSSIKQGPSIQCDYCPLTYHLDCLTSLSLTNEKWMCPNHMTPILDRYLFKKPNSNRVKIYHQYSQIESKTIIQDFDYIKQTNQSNRINISQIPKFIEEFYSKSNLEQKTISQSEIKDQSEEILSHYESSFAYDPSIWDILQSILNHIVHNSPYEFSTIIENDYIKKKSLLDTNQTNTLDTIDTLLQALNQPNFLSEQCIKNSINSLSNLIDLRQFRLSHAALIHLHSQNVIYIRKHVVWFGLSSLNDICLENFNSSHLCQSITERHACLYYDQKHNLFELLNYSEYGTIVNNLRYGLGIINDDDNENLEKCFCLTKSLCHSNWDGPAQIEQGTVIQIGCHKFLFYRHIVR